MAPLTRAVFVAWEAVFEGPEADEQARSGTTSIAWDLALTMRGGPRTRSKHAAAFDLAINEGLCEHLRTASLPAD
jgi:hypothetical protein